MKLVVLHYHLRPGGVRRVIELAAPHIVRAFRGRIESVTIASGEPPDAKWEVLFRELLGATPVEFFIEPAFHYFAGQNLPVTRIRQRLERAWEKLLRGCAGNNAVVWAHNLGIGRNLLLTRETTRAAERRKIPLLLHQHDWWFDNRWRRWPEMQAAGFRTLAATARTIFPAAKTARHLAINRFDANILQRRLGTRAVWFPNPVERAAPPSAASVKKTRNWLDKLLGGRGAPVWILPCRALRRKNMAEALLLTRWLRPEAWLITTGGASSPDEVSYFDRLEAAAQKHGWHFRPGVLRGNEAAKPTVAELMAASEAVLLTSIQEGFGLPYLEAAAAGRPLIARSLPNIAPDLKQLGFRFPQYYGEILVDPRLFDWNNERKRQAEFFRKWRSALPGPVRVFARHSELLRKKSSPRPMPFSRLTFSTQLEVMSQPVELSWKLCSPLNPFLAKWRGRAGMGQLRVTRWPRQAGDWLGGPAYAQRFAELAASPSKRETSAMAAVAAQTEFLRRKLDARHLFPLLWAVDT